MRDVQVLCVADENEAVGGKSSRDCSQFKFFRSVYIVLHAAPSWNRCQVQCSELVIAVAAVTAAAA
eukprot:CAMPEP_0172699348 /NCGR_PEP_ID=MMETSP1074-20121228/30116_1 /TAXON_ID=2916 /ORGANISM="Ceratium fusus, Strain PA161109" /LENGTH=65 /DNA_ID=CAMNT_0013520527 /DNA_START=277 /DNA_END=471 /DNA_ORIENTATION=-